MIAFEGGFHGRTLLSLSLTSKTHPYKAGLGPFAPEVYRVPFAERLPRARCARRRSPRSSARSITQVAAETGRRDRDRARAGRGRLRRRAAGVHRGRAADLRRQRDRARRRRGADAASRAPGRFFAIEHYDVEPDLITVAKSIAAGLPLSGVLGRAEIMDAPGPNAVGGTYVGNPVAQAAALAVLDVIEEEGLVERAAAIGETIRARMLEWQEPLRGDRRRSRARRDAGDRARPRPRVEGSRAGARRRPSCEAGAAQRPAAARAPGSTRTSSACSCRSTIADARARGGARASGSTRSSASSSRLASPSLGKCRAGWSAR